MLSKNILFILYTSYSYFINGEEEHGGTPHSPANMLAATACGKIN